MLKAESAERPFVRRWYEAMAGLALGETRWGEARDWAERGLRDFPDSAPMLLVVGSIEETFGALALLRLPDSVFSPIQRETRANLEALREARGHLERAHRSLRSAVAAEPSLAEARLRLGRVAWRLGETSEARSALEEVLARGPAARTGFLAHLFLGRIHEDAGRLDDAARSYEAALALDPHAQSARLALSHVRLRLGSPGVARREVEESVRAAGRRRSRTRSGCTPGDRPSASRSGSRPCGRRPPRDRPRPGARRGRAPRPRPPPSRSASRACTSTCS